MRHLLIIAALLIPTAMLAQGNVSQTGNNDFTGTNSHTGSETFSGKTTTANLNTEIFADQQSGSDACAKITASLGLLPATGGIIHAEGLTGAQSCASTLTISTPAIIYFGAATYTLNGNPGIAISSSDVNLTGVGAGKFYDIGSDQSATQFVGVSGSTIVQVTATSGAGNQALARDSIRKIEFNCNNAAAIGLQVLSERNGNFDDNTFLECTTTSIDVNVVATLGEARDAQFNSFSNVVCRNNAAASGHCIRLGGDSAGLANASFNSFSYLDVYTKNGNCLEDLGGDSNTFFNFACGLVMSGTSVGIHFSSINANEFARSETVYNASSTAGVKQEANATNNTIYHLEKENSGPEPTVSANTFTWTEDDRNSTGWHIPRLITNAFPVVPTCAVTGAGSGATCAVVANSSDGWGSMSISTGTSPSASGTATLTYSSAFGANSTACIMNLAAGNSAWNARATAIMTSTMTTTSAVVNWDNNAVALTGSQAGAYIITYFCGGR